MYIENFTHFSLIKFDKIKKEYQTAKNLTDTTDNTSLHFYIIRPLYQKKKFCRNYNLTFLCNFCGILIAPMFDLLSKFLSNVLQDGLSTNFLVSYLIKCLKGEYCFPCSH